MAPSEPKTTAGNAPAKAKAKTSGAKASRDGRVWNTKYGKRRVKEAPPTLEEALFAAKGITDDFNQQIEIAASLMGLPEDQVRGEAMKQKHTTTLQVRAPASAAGGTRSVVVERVVERRVVRRPIGAPRRIGT